MLGKNSFLICKMDLEASTVPSRALMTVILKGLLRNLGANRWRRYKNPIMALIVTSIRNKEPGQVNWPNLVLQPQTPLRKTNGPSSNPSSVLHEVDLCHCWAIRVCHTGIYVI